jgi:oligopeptide/dipeptide ABC transporter ATP-binding protein
MSGIDPSAGETRTQEQRIAAVAEAAPADALLSVRELKLSIGAEEGAFEPVTGATLHVNKGELLGVVGESGSGKSLTLRAIAGLLPPAIKYRSGEVRVAGIDVPHAEGADLRRLHGEAVGMIFQEPMSALNPTMRIGEQIAEAARAHSDLSKKESKQKAIELLERMGFTEAETRYKLYPHELSGGMRQRVMISIALAGEPQVLLCDEPTTALDATVTMRVLDLLVGLAKDLNIAIIFVTHDLGVAARICDRIVVMYAGRMVEEGPASEVLRRPRHPYTLALLKAVPTKDSTIEQLRAIPGNPPAPDEQIEGCPFAPRCDFAVPECAEPVELVAIGPQRMSACRRQELLGAMAKNADGNGKELAGA